MELGSHPFNDRINDRGKSRVSPICRAILRAESVSTAEVRVHMAKRWWEKDPWPYANTVFNFFRMYRTRNRNSVLLYFNLKKRTFAIVADSGILRELGSRYWDQLAQALKEDLRTTYHENAIATAILTLGISLEKHYPRAKPPETAAPRA